MEIKIFYSWQSDLPNASNRGFIENALEQALSQIRSQNTLKVEPVIDRDTLDVPGSPDIAETIFSKIEQAGVFVCDVTTINKADGSRPTPNPNVLVELGYAIRALGSKRIIMVANLAFGAMEDLPFDLRSRRVIPFNMPGEAADRSSERKTLAKRLEVALGSILSEIDTKARETTLVEPQLTLAQQSIQAIEEGKTNAPALTKKYLNEFMQKLESMELKPSGPEGDDQLVVRLKETIPLIVEFLGVVDSVVINGPYEQLLNIYGLFEKILEHYHPPMEYSGGWHKADFDYFKFLGHELFVSMFALLIREDKWEWIASLLERPFYVRNTDTTDPYVHFDEISQHVWWLDKRNERLALAKTSIHAEMLDDWHSQSSLSTIIPLQDFVDADYFLNLHAAFESEDSGKIRYWRAWSSILMKEVPQFLRKSIMKDYALMLAKALGVRGIGELRQKYSEKGSSVNALYRRRNPWFEVPQFDANRIGER